MQWVKPLGGQRQFLNNLDLKEPDAAVSPNHRFSHGNRSPTLIYNPQRGIPHPLTPSLLNTCRTCKPKHITWGGGLYLCVGGGCCCCCWGMWLCWETLKWHLFPFFKQKCFYGDPISEFLYIASPIERRIGGMKRSLMVTCRAHSTHSEIWPLHLTHPSTRSLVGAVGSYCTAPGEQWEWGGVRCLAQGHHGRAQEVNWDLSK